jgi:hypothetical protein
MHSLEYLLLLLAERIRRETNNSELADAAMTLASASHDFVPEGEERLGQSEMYREWSRRFDPHSGTEWKK